MAIRPDHGLETALDHAHAHALTWLKSLGDRNVPPTADADVVAEALGWDLPDAPTDPSDVIDLMVEACEPGLTAMPSGRFYGFVIGGTHPAALAADWLVSSWDQNSALRQVTPAAAALEEVASRWLLDLLGLPSGSAVGFVTGATMANFTCLAAGRDEVLRRTGYDIADGLAGSPGVRVLVGRERHASIDLAMRYLGLAAPVVVDVDDQGRILPDALAAALDEQPEVPTIVALQAGNLHSGAFDPFAGCIEIAHARGAWVHVDGAFGLWAAVSPTLRHLTSGMAGADSWATDAHKTLNVPYDSGLAIVRDPVTVRSAMAMHGDYLIPDEQGDPQERVPELSRRARGAPIWAVLRSLGRSGVIEVVDRLCAHATAFADGASGIDGAEVLNDVVFTQVSLAFGDDDRTRRVAERMLADGTAWMTASRWQGRAVLRISVSNWSTTPDDVARSLAALRRSAAVEG